MSQRNLLFLESLMLLLRSLHGPWVLALDCQNTPEQLSATGWLNVVDGVIAAPSEPTCGERTIDFFVVSRGLEHSIARAFKVHDADFDPHAPVRMLLKASPRNIKLRRMALPRAVPAVLPPACCPHIGSADGIDESQLEVPSRVEVHHLDVDELHRSWIRDAEKTWYSILAVETCPDKSRRLLGPNCVCGSLPFPRWEGRWLTRPPTPCGGDVSRGGLPR